MKDNDAFLSFIQNHKEHGKYHEMHLKDEPYEKIVSGIKKYELRLLDAKRKLIKADDIIRFDRLNSGTSDECIYAKVTKINIYTSFSELYDACMDKCDPISLYRCGSPEDTTKEDFLKRMETYYTPEEQKEYGVVAIQLKVICSEENDMVNSIT